MNKAASPRSSGDAKRARVREHYRTIATGGGCCSSAGESSSCCEARASATCGGGTTAPERLGYSAQQIASLPDGANLGLGCGNPVGGIDLHAGQVVLDLGSGAGIDCFLAAQRVGARGRVIGVDMTPEMVSKARENARSAKYRNVEFRLGEIEHLPVADRSVDVVISNCVINLAPDKIPVYREVFRVLRPGGQIAISDVVTTRALARRYREDLALWSSCVSGALPVPRLTAILRSTGFREVRVDVGSPATAAGPMERTRSLGVVAAMSHAVRPGG
jgi:arsenite methyltransferase